MLVLLSEYPGIVDGGITKDFGTAAIIALVCILMVFLLLGIIILITTGINMLIQKVEGSKKASSAFSKEPQHEVHPLDTNDEDAVVASIVASIDFRNEIKEDVRVISVKQI